MDLHTIIYCMFKKEHNKLPPVTLRDSWMIWGPLLTWCRLSGFRSPPWRLLSNIMVKLDDVEGGIGFFCLSWKGWHERSNWLCWQKAKSVLQTKKKNCSLLTGVMIRSLWETYLWETLVVNFCSYSNNTMLKTQVGGCTSILWWEEMALESLVLLILHFFQNERI